MGNCVNGNKTGTKAIKYAHDSHLFILLPKEISILELIYKDLSERIERHKINLENFLLFFHKNGFWGQRLFKEFDCDETKLISKQEFIAGIARIFKSSENQKIYLLFKFFSKNDEKCDGVYFQQFLIMLYNYPKEDLKWILNDKQFYDSSLKNYVATVDSTKKVKELNVYQAEYSRRRQLKAQQSERSVETAYPSMLCKEIGRNIEERYKNGQGTMNFSDENGIIQVKTTSIQSLIKIFAKKIFKEQKINTKQGKLNFDQFHHWISVHKGLYQNYYDGFHNLIWEIDAETMKPRFLTQKCDKVSEGRILWEKQFINCRLYLQHSILVVCAQTNLEQPLLVICLEGLVIARIYETVYGFGFSITHRDAFYKQKRIFVKNQPLLQQWMRHLKFYNGQSIQNKYKIGQKIGAGKFSIVYRGKCLSDDKQYAIKEIATYRLDEQSRNLIAHQSSIMKIISHPLLLQYKESIQTKTHMYIITQLVKGRDLFEFVKQNKMLSEYEAAKILLQLIVGIRFLHSFGIVHRDLKPQNIMIVCEEDTSDISYIKIIDFGFSNYLSKLVQKKTDQLLTGTPNYIAPEILKEEGISYKIDNFAIGSILYFMLTGNLAFNDTTVTGILVKTMKGEYKHNQKYNLSKQCTNLIDQLLQNNPNKRISLEDALQHPWLKILNLPDSMAKSFSAFIPCTNMPQIK